MTSPRQKLKEGAKFLALALLVWGVPVPLGAGTTERIVADRFTGLAIEGYDPVAYFVDAQLRPGQADIELAQGGVVWRFRSRVNRDIFAADPDIYAPRFGGHDPIDVARGVARAGRAQIWAVVDAQLFLFADDAHRDAFLRLPGFAEAATKSWPALEATLSR